MLRKSFTFIALSIAGCVIVSAQQSPAPVERPAQRIVLSAPFESSYLGVQTQEINKENFTKFGLASVQGVGIEKVVEDSPAAKAGLQNGDVIVRFEGEEVTSIRKLNRLIAETAPDHQAKITVLRGGSEREITATLGKRELPQFASGNFTFGNLQSLPNIQTMPALPRTQVMPQLAPFPPMSGSGQNFLFLRDGENRQIGIGVMPLTKQLGDYFGIAEGKGLLVNSVRENSPAAKAGLKAGDIIVEIEGKAVNEIPDLIRAVNEKKEGNISLTFIRDKNRQTISVTPEIIKEKMNSKELDRIFGDAPKQDSNN